MGLAMIHGIVMGCGGGISVQSTPGKGSRFTVCLPVTTEEAAAGGSEPEPLPRGSEHILLVDDETPVLTLQQRMLERMGYQVTARTGSLEALALFTAQPEIFNLVLTDMTMPDMTGEQLAREILRLRPDTPVVLFTGYSKAMSEEKARDLGIRAFLYKPVVKEQLARTIRHALDGGTPLYPS